MVNPVPRNIWKNIKAAAIIVAIIIGVLVGVPVMAAFGLSALAFILVLWWAIVGLFVLFVIGFLIAEVVREFF